MSLFEPITVFLSSFSLIALAEIGDKSQLVCMTLAARNRHWPVILGASLAFILLNTLAVLFGAAVGAWLSEKMTTGIVAVLFASFGVHAFLSSDDEDSQQLLKKTSHGIFFTTLLLIFASEFGDKTQIAIAGLASSFSILPVWLGATAALILISVLGIWVGRTVLQRLPLIWLRRFSGTLFLIFSGLAVFQLLVINGH